MRPQTEFCFARGCKVKLHDEKGFPTPGGVLTSSSLERSFCHEHGDLWIEVERDLPLAIQELLALALLYPEAMRREYIKPPEWQKRVFQAQQRVRRLRDLEEMLTGGE